MNCPICNKEIPDNSKFCSGCGKQVPRCPTCGKVLQKRTRFCTADGTPIPDEINALLPQTSAAPVAQAPSSAAPVHKPTPVPPAAAQVRRPAAPPQPAPQPTPKRSSAGKTVLIIVLVLAIVAVLTVGVIFALNYLGVIHEDSIFNISMFAEDDDREDDDAEEETNTGNKPSKDDAEQDEPVLMPNCVGQHYEDAAKTFDELNCTPIFEYAYSSDFKEGYVIAQNIPENEKLTEGTKIILTVSKGADTSPTGYDQKVVVTASSGSSYGTLVLYNWENGQWVSKFSCDAALGSNGISANYGEGTKRTPQGTFKLGIALSANSIPNNAWPCQLVTSNTCVVDDTSSPYYNTIQRISDLPSGVSYDPIGNTILNGYSNICIYIEHNGDGLSSSNVVAGKGSVITLCGRYSTLAPTAGCVDISSSNMLTLVSMLDHSKNPHIEISVQ